MAHTRRSFLKHLAGLGALAVAGCGSAWAAAKAVGRKPNIIFIMSDELGYYELSCMGNPHFKTPNVDRLAAEGVRFTQALAGSSVCAPTRCCLMTGKHSGHTSVRQNDGGTPLRADEETVASVLKRAGYATGGFGKWGCGGRGSTGVPEKHGFDVFVGYYDQVHAHSYYPPYIIRNSEEVPLEGNKGGSKGRTYSHYVIMDEAKKFIRESRDRPFFCYLPVTPPHGLFDIPDDDPAWALFKDKPWSESARRYAAMVAMVDRQVGEVLAMLKEFGLDENTIIFFSGDNGGADYFRDADHPRGFHGPNVNPKTGKAFRGHKGNLYEGGLRIPMIVRWPGKISSGRVSDFLWYFPDVLPTLAELAGAAAPKDVDGISIVPELIGEAAAGRKQQTHEFLYWEYGGQTAVRMGHWKAVRPGKDKGWELYDLNGDLEEANDVAARHPDVLAGMTAFAEQAHEGARVGVFHDRAIHERDRRAKFGDQRL
jgi:arylsulfatase A-like enzyme